MLLLNVSPLAVLQVDDAAAAQGLPADMLVGIGDDEVGPFDTQTLVHGPGVSGNPGAPAILARIPNSPPVFDGNIADQSPYRLKEWRTICTEDSCTYV